MTARAMPTTPADRTDVQRVDPPHGNYAPHVVFGPDGLAITIALGAVPPRSPYQAGDWVVCHGYPGYPAGPRRWGFRGYVTGAMGSTLLHGVTDDGREWCEHWGALQPDGAPCGDGSRCTCCPRGGMWRRVGEPRVEQPALFDLLAVVP